MKRYDMGHNDRPVPALLKEFQRLREFNLDLYVRTEGPAWERVGLLAKLRGTR